MRQGFGFEYLDTVFALATIFLVLSVGDAFG
jgi:hypothetical protein